MPRCADTSLVGIHCHSPNDADDRWHCCQNCCMGCACSIRERHPVAIPYHVLGHLSVSRSGVKRKSGNKCCNFILCMNDRDRRGDSCSSPAQQCVCIAFLPCSNGYLHLQNRLIDSSFDSLSILPQDRDPGVWCASQGLSDTCPYLSW